MRILVDMDGVLCDWVGAIITSYNGEYGTALRPDDCDHFHTEKCSWVKTDEQRHQVIKTLDSCMGSTGFWEALNPIDGAIDGMKRLVELGHDVVIATALPKKSREAAYYGKISWVNRWLGSFFNVHKNFIPIQRKDLLVADMLLDDGIHNLEAYAAIHGTEKAVAFSQPWNQNWKGHTVLSWENFLFGVRVEMEKRR